MRESREREHKLQNGLFINLQQRLVDYYTYMLFFPGRRQTGGNIPPSKSIKSFNRKVKLLLQWERNRDSVQYCLTCKKTKHDQAYTLELPVHRAIRNGYTAEN